MVAGVQVGAFCKTPVVCTERSKNKAINLFPGVLQNAPTFNTKKSRSINITVYRPACRKEATRTPDPYVPNVVRYQLRYFPINIA